MHHRVLPTIYMRAYTVFVQSQYDITCIGILTILRMFCCGDLAAADVHEDGNDDDDGLPAATPETAATTELQKGGTGAFPHTIGNARIGKCR